MHTAVKDWTIYRVLGPDGSRTGRAAHLVGTIENDPDAARTGSHIKGGQLMNIDLRRGRVGTHYEDIFLAGDGDEDCVTLDAVRTLRRELSPP